MSIAAQREDEAKVRKDLNVSIGCCDACEGQALASVQLSESGCAGFAGWGRSATRRKGLAVLRGSENRKRLGTQQSGALLYRTDVSCNFRYRDVHGKAEHPWREKSKSDLDEELEKLSARGIVPPGMSVGSQVAATTLQEQEVLDFAESSHLHHKK